MDYLYIFNHIPKCAGTTISSALKEWFNVEMDYQIGWKQDDYFNFVNNPFDLDQFKPNVLLSGHYCVEGSYLSQRYPQIFNDYRFRLITFVRDPLAQMTSLYKFREREGQNSQEDSLVKYLFHQRNFISRILECNELNYKEVVERYYFIGTQEKLQQSFNLLAHELNKPQIDLNKYTNNVSPKSQKILSLSEVTIQQFKDNNSLDYKIVDYCNKILNQKYKLDC